MTNVNRDVPEHVWNLNIKPVAAMNGVRHSDYLYNMETRIGRVGMIAHNGIIEVWARCTSPNGGTRICSYGLFASYDDVPTWMWNAA